jgi:fatty acyl-CoA reductase
MSDPPGSLSIRAQFEGSTVLLTGATGYVGGLVLESFLRTCPGVERVYVLARGKRTESGKERVHR